MFKKISNKIVFLLAYSFNSIVVWASSPNPDELVPLPVQGNTHPDAERIADLPKVNPQTLITTAIKTILGWAMILSIIAIVVASIYYILARGQEEKITKAKEILIYLIVGIAIMAAAYGVISGIVQFDFFT